MRRGRPSLDLVQLGMADAAGQHLDQQFSVARDRLGEISQPERRRIVRERADGIQDHGAHFVGASRSVL